MHLRLSWTARPARSVCQEGDREKAKRQLGQRHARWRSAPGRNRDRKRLLIGFDHDHQTAVRHGENSGRTLAEANVVRSIRKIGDWQGAALRLNAALPEGQDVAHRAAGAVVGAARLRKS
jgi:hypothetical protein